LGLLFVRFMTASEMVPQVKFLGPLW